MNEAIKNKLLIIGASGHGKVVADIALKIKRWDKIAFLDDNELSHTSLDLNIIGKSTDFYEYLHEYEMFVAIGYNEIREKIQNQLEQVGASIPVLVHPNAVLGEQVEIQPGTVIMAGVIVNSCTKIGKGCIINTGAIIEHDNIIENYSHISPGVCIAGTVRVGEGTWLGIGSIISNNISITSKCIIGAGAVVIKNINLPGTYIGNPARKVEKGE